MAIPGFQSIMLPLLRFIADGKDHSLRQTIEVLVDEYRLTEEERKDLLPSGRRPARDNRVGWARTYRKKAGLQASTRRSHFRITARGLAVLAENPPEIGVSFLRRYPDTEGQTSGWQALSPA